MSGARLTPTVELTKSLKLVQSQHATNFTANHFNANAFDNVTSVHPYLNTYLYDTTGSHRSSRLSQQSSTSQLVRPSVHPSLTLLRFSCPTFLIIVVKMVPCVTGSLRDWATWWCRSSSCPPWARWVHWTGCEILGSTPALAYPSYCGWSTLLLLKPCDTCTDTGTALKLFFSINVNNKKRYAAPSFHAQVYCCNFCH